MSVVDLQPNLSGLGARRCVGGLSKTASLAGIFVGSWLVSFASMTIAIGYVRVVVGVDFGGREGLCLVGGAASALAATGLGLFVGTLPVKGGKASKSGILTGCLLYTSRRSATSAKVKTEPMLSAIQACSRRTRRAMS